MIASLNIIDNFFGDVSSVRQFALSHDFTQEPEHDGHKYPGFAPVKDERFLRHLEERLLESTGHQFKVNMAHFAAGTKDHRTVQWIHADNGCGSFAGVAYLFDEPGWGTAFWRHKDLNVDTLSGCVPTSNYPSLHDWSQFMQKQGQTSEAWTRTDYADSRLNRLIFYPTDRFHSRWPEESFGDKPENCRLTLAFFFDLA